MTIALLVEPEDQTVDPGAEAAFTVQIVNQSGIVDRVAIDILGLAGGWARAEPPAVALMPGTDATAIVYITPPFGTPLGPVAIGIRGTAETSGHVEVGEANLNVGASRSIEAELRPRTATGKRRATSVVVLHNTGNAPTKVQVVATDPDDAIVFDAPTAVQIGPGATAELPLRMRLPSREKQGASLPYSVLVEGGETGQSLDGLVRQPAKKRWPLLALMMLLALVLLAVVLLRPQNSKAITGGKPDEPTVPTVPGAATTVPAAVTTVAGPATTAGPAPGPGGPAPTVPGGGPATTKAATVGVVPTAPPTLPPTTTPAKPAVVCPGVKGTPKETAQRVVCAWQGQPSTLQGEIDKTITGAAATALVKVAPSPKGQVAGGVFPDPGGTRVTFACPTGGGGVKELVVGPAGLVTTLGPSC